MNAPAGFVEWSKERKPVQMIAMQVGQDKINVRYFISQCLTKEPHATSRIDNKQLVIDLHTDTGGIPSILQRLCVRYRIGAAYAPVLNDHSLNPEYISLPNAGYFLPTLAIK